MAKAAQAGFARAIQHAARGGAMTPALREAEAMARLAVAEREVETILAGPPVPRLRGGAKDVPAVQTWLEAWQARSGPVEQTLTGLAGRPSPARVAAAARLALLADALAGAIATMARPANVTTRDRIIDFEQGRADAAEPFVTRALDAATACLALAAAGDQVDDGVATCFAIVERWAPERFPLDEHVAAPATDLTVIDRER